MSAHKLPASLDAAVAELNGLGALLTATEWHRAAIVASFVRLDLGNGRRELSNIGQPISARAFADLGIAGLSSTSTVTRYVEAWLSTHRDKHPLPGSIVELPTSTFPTVERNEGSRVAADPVDAVRQVIDKHGAAKIAAALVDEHPEDVREALYADLPFGGKIPDIIPDREPPLTRRLVSRCVTLTTELDVLAVHLAGVEIDEELERALVALHAKAVDVLGRFASAEGIEDVLREWSDS